MNNTTPATSTAQSKFPAWVIFTLGFLAALQLVQFIMFFVVFSRVNNLEDELKASHREVRQEIIHLLKKGG